MPHELISSCVGSVFISHQKNGVNHGVAFLHPPLIQLHLVKSTRQTKLENFLTAVERLRVFLSQADMLWLQNSRHKEGISLEDSEKQWKPS